MKTWLKGGLWGLGVGIIYEIYKVIGDIFFLPKSGISPPLVYFIPLIYFFLGGVIVGWLNENWDNLISKIRKK